MRHQTTAQVRARLRAAKAKLRAEADAALSRMDLDALQLLLRRARRQDRLLARLVTVFLAAETAANKAHSRLSALTETPDVPSTRARGRIAPIQAAPPALPDMRPPLALAGRPIRGVVRGLAHSMTVHVPPSIQLRVDLEVWRAGDPMEGDEVLLFQLAGTGGKAGGSKMPTFDAAWDARIKRGWVGYGVNTVAAIRLGWEMALCEVAARS